LNPEAGALRRRDGEPAFTEPWQAETMALAARLVEQDRFTATQWSATLGEEIRRAADAGAKDDVESYFAAALRALERLTIEGGLVDPQELTSMTQAWTEAYESTPHGQPVRLPVSASGSQIDLSPSSFPLSRE
jgi:nitrile hydratase accessory protein